MKTNVLFLSLALSVVLLQGCDWFKKKEPVGELPAGAKPVVYKPGKTISVVRNAIARKSLSENLQDFKKRRTDLNQTIYGQSYLTRAIQTDNIEAVRLILNSGVDVDAPDQRYGFPPIFFAIKEHMVVPELSKPDPAATDEEVQIYEGYIERKESIVDSSKIFNLLIAQGADVNSVNTFSETVLHAAIRKGRKDLVLKLVTLNADIHAYPERLNKTPLMYAAYYGNWEILEILIQAGADATDESDDGEAALALAEKRTFPKEDKELYPFIDYDKTIAILKANGAR